MDSRSLNGEIHGRIGHLSKLLQPFKRVEVFITGYHVGALSFQNTLALWHLSALTFGQTGEREEN